MAVCYVAHGVGLSHFARHLATTLCGLSLVADSRVTRPLKNRSSLSRHPAIETKNPVGRSDPRG
jgi:hypothetical protein